MTTDRAAKAVTSATAKPAASARLPRGTKQLHAVQPKPNHSAAWQEIRERGVEISARLDALLDRLS